MLFVLRGPGRWVNFFIEQNNRGEFGGLENSTFPPGFTGFPPRCFLLSLLFWLTCTFYFETIHRTLQAVGKANVIKFAGKHTEVKIDWESTRRL